MSSQFLLHVRLKYTKWSRIRIFCFSHSLWFAPITKCVQMSNLSFSIATLRKYVLLPTRFVILRCHCILLIYTVILLCIYALLSHLTWSSYLCINVYSRPFERPDHLYKFICNLQSIRSSFITNLRQQIIPECSWERLFCTTANMDTITISPQWGVINMYDLKGIKQNIRKVQENSVSQISLHRCQPKEAGTWTMTSI